MAVVLAALSCRSAHAQGTVKIDVPAASAFEKWLAQHPAPNGRTFANPEDRAEGLKLVQLRAKEMRALLEREPGHFLQSSMPEADRLRLPADLQPFIERRVRGRGSFAAYCRFARNDGPPPLEPAIGLGREVRLAGKVYQAFVFGSWKDQVTVQDAAIDGVMLGDAIVLGDSSTPAEQVAAGEPVVASAPTTTGPNTVLYIVARFSDESAEPIDDATALNYMSAVNAFWLNNSGGTVSIRGLVNPGQVMDIVHVQLPQPLSYASTYNANFAQLLSDARSAASAKGVNYANYNLDVTVTVNAAFSYAGRAYIGAQGAHLTRGYVSLRTAGHELGHNLGLFHADYWRTDSVNPFGKDSNPGGCAPDSANGEWIEYGHYFSIMSAQYGGEIDDPTKPHHAPVEKVRLGWLSGTESAYASSSGTYRIFRHDHRDTTGTPRAIRIETPATDYTGYGRRYWLGYRFAPWNVGQSWLRNGLQIDVAQTTYGGDGAIMLDMTPYSKDEASGATWSTDNVDKRDGALVVGHTYSDAKAGIHLTPVTTGNNGVNEEYLDVVINLGTFPNNQAPLITAFSVTTNQVSPGQPVNFSVTAADPDAEPLAYSWDFDEVQIWTSSGLNSPSATKSWPGEGQRRVTVTVSDMKGGVSTKSTVITVGNPAGVRQILGRVLWAGQPVVGARIWTTSAGSVLNAWSHSDGSYVLAGLDSNTTFTVQCMAEGLTFAPQFSNPVSVFAGHAFGCDFYAREPLAGSDGSLTYTLSGQVTDGGTGVAGAEVHCGGWMAVTDSSGNYQFTNFPSGTYTVVPDHDAWSFSPATRSVTVNAANSTGNNFARQAPYSLSGRIDGPPASSQSPAPRIYLSNGRSVLATKAGGGSSRYWAYTLASVPAGQYSLSAELSGYALTPVGFGNPLAITGNLTSLNFTGVVASVAGAISGRVTEYGAPLMGVTVRASVGGSPVGTTETDSDGTYRLGNLPGGSYALTASKVGYACSPASITVSSVPSTDRDFLATGAASPPQITSISGQPTVVAGVAATTTLSAIASGTAPLKHRWDAVSGRGPVTFSANDSPTATSTTVGFQAAGNYVFRLRVSDGAGLAATSSVAITVNAGPRAMVVAPYEVQVPSGGTVSFRADGWDDLGTKTSLTPAWSVSGGGTIDAAGVFTATTPGGPYLVGAVSGGLSATGFVWVTPGSGPSVAIVTQPQSQVVTAGSNALFSVTAAGTPPLRYQWWRNGITAITGATNSTLAIYSVADADAGFYSVVVSNGASVTSANAQLVINHPPVAPSPQFTCAGSGGLKMRAMALCGSDPDADPVALWSIAANSTAGGVMRLAGEWVWYVPPASHPIQDTFAYVVADGRGGFSQGLATILLVADDAPTFNLAVQVLGDASASIQGDGIPDRAYSIQFTESLATPLWQTLGSAAADAFGSFQFTDHPPLEAPARFYRAVSF